MRQRFSGLLGTPPAADSAPDAPGIRLECAQIHHRDGVHSLRIGDDLVLAIGTPRFESAHLQALAQQSGPAAAWHEVLRQADTDRIPPVRGRFAAAFIGQGGRRAVFINDRFGTWPICYHSADGVLRFADRADAVPLPTRTISEQAIFDYLFFHMIPAPETIFEGVRRLPAAHLLVWTAERTELRPWWQPHFAVDHQMRFEDAKAQFLGIIETGVAREAAAGSVGCFLSGGTDSSTVTGMLRKVSGEAPRSYSIGFDASGYDEMEFARIAAQRFGADHREYYVTPDDLLAGIPTVATHYDQPFGNSSAVPAWVCASRAQQDGIGKLLAGDGGDELFGGNARYAKQRVFGLYDRVPSALRKHLMEPLLGQPLAGRIPLVKKAASYVEQARVPLPERMSMYNMLRLLGLEQVFAPEFLARIDTGHPSTLECETWNAIEPAQSLNRILAFDWKYTLSDNDLPKVIGTTDLAGVDVGFPMLSDELVDFSLTVPTDWKLKGLTLRWFFKEALRGFLPDEIITKKKHGFGLPFGVWACQHEGLRAMTREALEGFRARGIVQPGFIDALLDTHLPAHPGYYGEMAWIIMMIELWLRDHSA